MCEEDSWKPENEQERLLEVPLCTKRKADVPGCARRRAGSPAMSRVDCWRSHLGTDRTSDVPGCAGRIADISELLCRTAGRPNVWDGQLNVPVSTKGLLESTSSLTAPPDARLADSALMSDELIKEKREWVFASLFRCIVVVVK
jgi:hypothetical protein